MAIRVTGADEIARVAAAVRSVGADRQIVNDMAKEIRGAIPPIRTAIRVNAVDVLPDSGGLGTWVSKARITGVVRRAASSAGVTIRGGRNSSGGRTDLRRIDKGRTRHKSWGRPPWHAQVVKPGFFTDAVTEEGLDQLEQAVLIAAEHAQERIVNG